MKALLARPLMGTDLTARGALATLAVAPVVWAIMVIAYVGMPS